MENTTMNIAETLKTRIVDKTVTIDGNSKTTKTATNLKAKDFSSKELYKGYKTRIFEFVKVLPEVANAVDESKEYYAARTKALTALENIAAYLEKSCNVQKVKMTKAELRFIVDRSRGSLRITPDGKGYEDRLKAESGIQSLIEIVYWHKLNGLALPIVKASKSTETKIARESEKSALDATNGTTKVEPAKAKEPKETNTKAA